MIGRTLSHYRILSKLGEGAMGQVYLAEDTTLGRKVALKIPPAEMAADPVRRQRYEREARTVAALNHPNIVTLHSIEEAEGVRFLTMEFVEGKNLAQLLPEGGFTLDRLFELAIPVTDALSAAHEAGITHRDLKPENIMVSDTGQVKILDFGLAKLRREGPEGRESEDLTQTLTQEGMVMGTVPYMSPEQVQGQPIGSRSDIFSLGVILYEMATGHRPFRGQTSAHVVSSIMRDEPSPLTDLRVDLPHQLGRVIKHCLEKDPERRFQSAKDVRYELEELKSEMASGAAPAGRAVPVASKGKGPAMRFALAIALMLLFGAAGAYLWRAARGPERGRARIEQEAAGREFPATSTPMLGKTDSIAVLPFADLSPAKDQDYFCDGMTEELIHALTRVDGLKVPARSSVFAFKGKGIDVRKVGETLGVAHVLEGSVRRAGDRLRISAQLVKVADGFQLWSETYDRELKDVFSIQDELATKIVQALEVAFTPRVRRALEKAPTGDLRAYDLYLRGRRFFYRRGKRDLEVARRMFSEAIEVDPGYALAYTALADTISDSYFRYGGPQEQLDEAERATQKAVELDPELAEAHASRGLILSLRGQYDEAEEAFNTAILLDPKLFEAYYFYARSCFASGKPEQAAVLFEKASELRPEDYLSLLLIPPVYRSLGRDEEAEAANRRGLKVLERHLQLNPDDVQALVIGAASLVDVGERERGLEWANNALAMDPDDARLLYNLACTYALAGQIEEALQALDQAVDAGWRRRNWTENDADLEALRGRPDFQVLLERMESRKSG